VQVAVDANRPAFENDLLRTLTGRPAVRVPQPRGQALTYDSSTCRLPYVRSGPAGPVSVETVATGPHGFEFLVGELHEGRTLADLRAAIARADGRLEPPPWLSVRWRGSTPPHSRMTWIGTLSPGRMAIACVDQTTGRTHVAGQVTVTAAR
jgi:hypothetical protein